MSEAPKSLPSDPAALRVTAEGLMQLAKAQALRIAKLEHQLAGHNRHRFGSKSESADQLDLQLRLEEEETAAAKSAPPEPKTGADAKTKPKRKPLPPELPRNDTVLSPGDECACGGKLRTISEDITEDLEYIPGRFVVSRIIRPRMACACCEKIVQAALPSPARQAMRSIAERGVQSSAGVLALVCWRMCWSRSMPTTFRSIASPKSMAVRTSISIARPWPIGWAARRRC